MTKPVEPAKVNKTGDSKTDELLPLSSTSMRISSMKLSREPGKPALASEQEDDKPSRPVLVGRSQVVPFKEKRASTDLQSVFSQKTRKHSITVESITRMIEKYRDEERFLVRPDNPNLQVWDMTIFSALLFTAVVTPFEVAFVETDINALFFVNRFVDILFICDMILNFILMYHHENGRLVKSHRLIRKRYFRGWFTIDFLTILPFDSAKYVFSSGKVKIVRIIRLLRLFKLLRIVRASRIFTRWETKLGIDHGSMTYIKLCFTLSALTHWFACFWGLTAFMQSEEETTWLTIWLDGRLDTPTHCTTSGAVGGELKLNGGFRTGCLDMENVYIACFQLAVMTITGSGPAGGIEPCNVTENVTIALMTLLCGVAWANIIGQICGLAASGDPVQQKFYQTNDDLNRLMRETHIKPDMRQHVRLYMRHSKNAMRERARKDILTNLSPELSGQMAIMGQRWIKDRMVFWVKNCSPAFLALLITRMDAQAYAPKEIISANDSMYILKKGTCMTNRLMMKSSVNTVWNIDFVLTHPAYDKIKQMVAGRTLTFVQVDILTLETFQDLMAQGFPEKTVIIRKIRWWAVLRTIQYAWNQEKMKKYKKQSQNDAKRNVGSSPRTPFKQNSAEVKTLLASHATLAEQIAALTALVKEDQEEPSFEK